MRCRPSTASSCIGDDELNRFLRQRYFPKLTEAAWRRQCDVARTFPDSLRQQGAMPVIELVGEKAERYVAMGNTATRWSLFLKNSGSRVWAISFVLRAAIA